MAVIPLLKEGEMLKEAGITGVPVFSGRYGDRYLADLQGPEGIQAMARILRIEPAAYTLHNAVLLTARQATWSVEPATAAPADVAAAAFVESCLFDMSHDYWQAVQFALSALPFGFADLEIVLKRRLGPDNRKGPASQYDDGLVGLRKLAPRRQETIKGWEMDENGGPQAMIQTNPEDGKDLPPIPIARLLHFRAGDDRGAWEGLGWLEPAYKLFHLIQNLEIIMGVGHQRSFVGLPVFAYTGKPDAETRDQVARIGRSLILNEQQYVAYPEQIVSFRLESVSNANAAELRNEINQLRWELLALGLAQFLRLGSTATGARALADPLIRLFQNSVDAALADIAAVQNRHLVPRLLAYNPSIAAGVTAPPQITASTVIPLPVEIMEFLTPIQSWMAAAAPDDQLWLRRLIGMPETVVEVQPPAEQVNKQVNEQVKENPNEDAAEEGSEGDDSGDEAGLADPIVSPTLRPAELSALALVAAEYSRAAALMAPMLSAATRNGARNA